MNEAKSHSGPQASDNRTNIGTQIVISFHEQFAQNQNHHQKLFLQVLLVLLSVLAGFGYLYVRVNAKSPDLAISVDTLYYYLALSILAFYSIRAKPVAFSDGAWGIGGTRETDHFAT